MNNPTDLFGYFFNEQTGYSIIIEADKKVAYAYLIDESDDIIGDVWLYNCGDTPQKPEWGNPSNMPFANTEKFIKQDDNFQPVSDISEITVSWFLNTPIEAHIYIKGELFAVLCPDSKPGWSAMAAIDNPLAKRLSQFLSCKK